MDYRFERVYTVNDFYDGPRAGFAGRPHAYRSIWRDDLDDWDPDDRFELSPISEDSLACALEDWGLWKRWEEAYYAGETDLSKHPALPQDQARHAELAPKVEQALEIDPARRRLAFGEFRSRNGARGGPGIPTSRAELEVRWTPAAEPGAAGDVRPGIVPK